MARKVTKRPDITFIPQPYPLWAAFSSYTWNNHKEPTTGIVSMWRQDNRSPILYPVIIMSGDYCDVMFDTKMEELGEYVGDRLPKFYPSQAEAEKCARGMQKKASAELRKHDAMLRKQDKAKGA